MQHDELLPENGKNEQVLRRYTFLNLLQHISRLIRSRNHHAELTMSILRIHTSRINQTRLTGIDAEEPFPAFHYGPKNIPSQAVTSVPCSVEAPCTLECIWEFAENLPCNLQVAYTGKSAAANLSLLHKG